ncbi:MAG: hypothetical protein HJJLKODD_00908 [Phycisphaerae bacterium]|nr:hypothetical protein [Phycisphaerae bacterium]
MISTKSFFMLLPGIALLSGCGYSTQRPFPTTVDTVYVEMFQNRDFRQDLEYQLTEAIAKRIEMDTPYQLATREKAHTMLSGEIVEVRQNVLGNDPRTDLPRETAATFILSYRWQDLRSGKILAERQLFPFTTTYIRPVGESFYDASVRGLDGVAQQLVETMESPW